MAITTNSDILVSERDIRIDDVSGLPRVTIDQTDIGGIGPISFRLMPDAVRALVDALIGTAEPPPGEARVVAKMLVSDLAKYWATRPTE